MTVAELVKQLASFPQAALVVVDTIKWYVDEHDHEDATVTRVVQDLSHLSPSPVVRIS